MSGLTSQPHLGALLPPVDLEAKRAEAEKVCGRQIDDRDLASYLMYPKVFADFCAHRAHYGAVSLLPTPAFFYGRPPPLITRCYASPPRCR
jgi:pyruvate carboxylase